MVMNVVQRLRNPEKEGITVEEKDLVERTAGVDPKFDVEGKPPLKEAVRCFCLQHPCSRKLVH